MNHRLYKPFASAVLTPFYFDKDLQIGDKQIRFNAYVEQLYLYSTYYQKNCTVLEELQVKPQEYVIVRYIAYDAHHDLVTHPLSDKTKKRIVTVLAKHYRVFVSLEKNLNDPFYDQYALQIAPEKMHDLEANAKFMVTEGATMASESFVHGVPYLYLNPLRCGYIDYQCRNFPDRAFQTTNEKEAIDLIKGILTSDIDNETARIEIEKHTINPTAYLEWFVENFPDSKTSDYRLS